LSHTKLEELPKIIDYIKNRTSVPICIDTEGAQIRTGELLKGEVILQENNIIKIPRQNVRGNEFIFNFYPFDLIDKFQVGDLVSIDFNSVLAQVIRRQRKYIELWVLIGGLVKQNKAVTLKRHIEIPAITKKDYKALSISCGKGISHFALSFANRAEDVDMIRAATDRGAFIISKIESGMGIQNLEEIAKRSDALLIDRGDLSREIPIELIPYVQKQIIQRSKKIGKKIYVATNLLESMVNSPTPTRAEVNDIFNTLNDGADGLVLAAETAIGKHPVNCAVMVSKIIKHMENFSTDTSLEDLVKRDSFLLVEPHGGVLVNKIIDDPDLGKIKKYKKLIVDRTVISNAEQIAIGTFSPLEGFMDKKELESVLKNYRLPSGIIWPLPVVLQIKQQQAQEFKIGEDIALVLKDTSDIYAVLHIEEIYTYDLDKIAKETFGTNDSNHPGVQSLKKQGDCFLSGKIGLIKRLPSKYKHYELTPLQIRTIFENKGWSRVVGFHTRNVAHRVHEHIQMLAFQKHYCDGLFIHPVIGPKKKNDYTEEAILKTYELMIQKYYPEGKVFLAAFQNYSRYAGPREGVFTALCRKNFGCSHFVVGRDHTGVGNYYKADDTRKLFDCLGDIG
ncbi:MAG: sulfate adenylyltransferase, partial [Candidatus Omnitrophica bacterium]|nr:sulfate adenylyltransferase [Candidatus Omnitrophota bacterium]